MPGVVDILMATFDDRVKYLRQLTSRKIILGNIPITRIDKDRNKARASIDVTALAESSDGSRCSTFRMCHPDFVSIGPMTVPALALNTALSSSAMSSPRPTSRAGCAPLGGQQPRHVGDQFPGHVEHGTIGNHVESSPVEKILG